MLITNISPSHIVVVALCHWAVCSVDLRPSGLESVCPGTVGPITVVCNLTWSSTDILRWDVDPHGVNQQTVFHTKDRSDLLETISNVGVIHFISKTSSYIVSILDIPESRGLIPMAVTCGDGFESEQHLLVKYKGMQCCHLETIDKELLDYYSRSRQHGPRGTQQC